MITCNNNGGTICSLRTRPFSRLETLLFLSLNSQELFSIIMFIKTIIWKCKQAKTILKNRTIFLDMKQINLNNKILTKITKYKIRTMKMNQENILDTSDLS